MDILTYGSRALNQSDLAAATAYFHGSRERFFGGGVWLTHSYVEGLLSRCLTEGAILGLFDRATRTHLRGMVGYWMESAPSDEQHGPTVFVPFALSSGRLETLAFLAGLTVLTSHLEQKGVQSVAFLAAEDDLPRRRLYSRFGVESGREEKRGFQVIRYTSPTTDLRDLTQRMVSRHHNRRNQPPTSVRSVQVEDALKDTAASASL